MTAALARFQRWLRGDGELTPFTISLQVGRSLLALGTLLTLVFNDDSVLFHSSSDEAPSANCAQLGRFGAFCLFGDNLEGIRLAGIAVALLVMIGALPCVTSVAYWYVAASVFANAKPVDGGDQITAVLAFMLMCASISDTRMNAWTRGVQASSLFIVPNVILVFIPIQMAFVYLNAAVAKFSAPVWAEGSALWYWFQHPGFNATPWAQEAALTLLAHPWISAFTTWGVLALELGLAAALLFSSSTKSRMSWLVIGLAFHLCIALLMGLVSFGIAMGAGLWLSLRRARSHASPDLLPIDQADKILEKADA